MISPQLSQYFSHAANWLKDRFIVDSICCIYPTAPLLKSSDLKKGWQILSQSGLDYVFGATSYRFPIQRAFTVDERNRISVFDHKLINARSQDLDSYWHDAGQFYWGKMNAWLKGDPIFSNKSAALQLPHYRVQDIDTISDWKQAELMFKSINSSNK